MKAANMALMTVQKNSTCFFLESSVCSFALLVKPLIYFKDTGITNYMCANCHYIATSQMLF